MAKMTIEFNDRMSEMLGELAAKYDTTKVDIIRRALALYRYVRVEVVDQKRQLVVTQDDKVIKEISMV